MKSHSFNPFKSHKRGTRIFEISSDPTEIHEIWKQFLEGIILHAGIVDNPFVLLAKDMRTAILHPSLL